MVTTANYAAARMSSLTTLSTSKTTPLYLHHPPSHHTRLHQHLLSVRPSPPVNAPKLRTTLKSTNRSDRPPPAIPPKRGVAIKPNSLTDFTEPDVPTYWYHYQALNPEYSLSMVETSHWQLVTQIQDPYIPKTFYQAINYPDWAAAVNKERAKFELNNCLAEVPYTGQHLVPMM